MERYAREASSVRWTLFPGLVVWSVAFALVGDPSLVLAQVRKLGPEFDVTTYVTAGQQQPRVCTLAHDGFISVWLGSNPIRTQLSGTRGQIFQRGGDVRGQEFLVTDASVTDENVEQVPDVARAGDGGFVVAWESYYSSSLSNIGARRYSAAGAPIGGEIQVNTGGPAERSPSVGADAGGNFVVAWVDGITTENNTSVVKARKFTSSGEPSSDEIDVADIPGFSSDASVAMGADGHFVVVWAQLGRDRDGGGIFGQRFDSTGLRIGANFNADPTSAASLSHPEIAIGNSGRFVVVWQSYGEDGSGYGIFGRTFSSDAQPIGERFQGNTYWKDNQALPSVALDSQDGFVVIWESYVSPFVDEGGQDGSGRGIFGQRFGPDGGKQGREFQVNTYTQGNQGNLRLRESDVSAWGNGDFVAVWTSPGQDGDLQGVFGQRFSLDASLGPLCGDAANSDLRISARDALVVLLGAVGIRDCERCICDADGSGPVTAADALAVLRAAVGLGTELTCPPCPR